SSYDDTVNPRVGFVYSPVDQFVVKVFYGTAFLAPSPASRYLHFGSFVENSDVIATEPFISAHGASENDGIFDSFFFYVANPDLEPEELENLDINLLWLVNDHLQLGLTLYREKVSNMILPRITDPAITGFIDGGAILTTQISDNIGQLTATGADFTLLYQLASIKLWSSLSLVEGKLEGENSSEDLPLTAERKLKIGLTWRVNQWFITPSAHIIGKTNISAGETVDAYEVVHLYAGYTDLFDHLTLTLRIQNLLDQRYDNAATFSGSFPAVAQEMRSVEFGAIYRF
ncbi:MAG: TonB-dependent receptor, partial [Pseudomonadales bacterium]|nr:TonB-dependent receptor [Pseudomonadales bacterium]